MQHLWGLLNNGFVLLLLPAAFAWQFTLYNKLLNDRDGTEFLQLRGRISGQSNREALYKSGLTHFLNFLDRFFSGAETVGHTPPVLTARAYDKCLLMALAYPLAAAILGWLLFGNAGELGRSIGLGNTPEWLPRVMALLYLIIMGGLAYKVLKADVGKYWVWVAANLIVLFVGGQLLLPLGVPTFILVIGAFAFAGTLAGTGTVAFAGALAFAVAVAVAVAGAVAVAVAGAVAGAVAVAGAGAGAVAVAVAGAVAVPIIMIGEKKPHLMWLVLLLISCLGFAIVFIAAKYVPDIANNQASAGLLIGLVLLPVVNVPFDFVSIALTRTLLRKNLLQTKILWRLGYSLLDFACALLFMVLLAMVMVISLQAFDNIAGADLMNVRAVLTGIGETPAGVQHFWIYFALFSTLLPTMIHAFIGVSSLITFRIVKPAHALSLLEQDTDAARFKLTSFLTGQFFASIALVILGAWGLLWFFGSLLGLSDILLNFLLQVQAKTAAIFS